MPPSARLRAPLTLCVALCLSVGFAPAAHAQSGLGGVRGVVLPRVAGSIGGYGDWKDAPDSARVATVTLTPLRTLACRARPETDCAPRVVPAMGMYGRYRSPRLSMGDYRMDVSAPGCTPFTAPLVILSDSESVVHVALVCAGR